MNPFTSATYYRVAHSMQTDMSVVVAANSEDRRYLTERTHQIAKLA